MDVQRRGVGSALFTRTFAEAKRLGYEKFFTFVRADNGVGLAAYLKQGFEIVGRARQQAKIEGTTIDEIVIEKQL
jgi:ribosomal protein S18 acetylase RimI-like enzyme